jgi:hypothetical protein
VFNNPVKIPQWILPPTSRTQRVLFSSLCLSAHLLDAPLAEYLLTEHPTVLSSCARMHLLNAHLAELSESSVILSLLNSQQSSSSVHSLHLLNAHLAELYRILSDSIFYELTAEFFLCTLLAPTQCPPDRALQNPQ